MAFGSFGYDMYENYLYWENYKIDEPDDFDVVLNFKKGVQNASKR